MLYPTVDISISITTYFPDQLDQTFVIIGNQQHWLSTSYLASEVCDITGNQVQYTLI